MTTRLAAAFALFASTACVTSSSDPLDDLAPYDGSTGGGKFDDPNCTDATYRAFIKDYLPGRVATDANPCKSGNDASYRIWAYVAGQQLGPVIDAYFEAATHATSAAQLAAAGTLGAATLATLDKLAMVRPANAGKIGYGQWIQDLYTPAVQAVTIPCVNLTTVFQRGREVTPYEAEWLDWIEHAQPNVVEPGSYAIWFDTISSSFEDVHRAHELSGSADEAADNAWMARLAKAAPPSKQDADGAAFQANVTQPAGDDYAGLVQNVAFWTEAITLEPAAGGPLSYKAWATVFADIAQGYADSTPSAAQKALLDVIVAARPCAAGADVDLIVNRLKTGLASAGTDGSGRALADDAVPTACM